MVKAKGAFQLIRKELVAESEQVKKSQVVWLSAPLYLLHSCKTGHLAIKLLLGYFSVELVA